MARKSIKGYAEKNYYDNTRFNGGVVATNDPLNEGSFKHLVNFDIADTGQSITPRKGFLTTKMVYKVDGTDVKVALDKDTIYFYDENLGQYVFLTYMNNVLCAYRCPFDSIKDNHIQDCGTISVINFADIGTINTLEPVYNEAKRIVDENFVTCYVTKVKLNGNYIWLKLFYREKQSTYAGVDYAEDTLVLSYLNTNDIGDYVDTNYRNLASTQSVIPNPMQELYSYANTPVGHIDKLPMLYFKTTDGKYLINTYQTLDGLKIYPNYNLREDNDENYVWAYTYEIVSSNRNLQFNDNVNYSYKAPIFYLSNNTVYNKVASTLYEVYSRLQSTTYNENKQVFGGTATYDEYVSYIEELKKPVEKSAPSGMTSYIVYMIPNNGYDPITINLSDTTTAFGVCNMVSRFSNTRIERRQGVVFDTETINRTDAHNAIVESNSIFSSGACTHIGTHTKYAHNSVREYFEYLYSTSNYHKYKMYIEVFDNSDKSILNSQYGYNECVESKLMSKVYSWKTDPISLTNFKDNPLYAALCNAQDVTFKYLNTSTKVLFTGTPSDSKVYSNLFPDYVEGRGVIYTICTTLDIGTSIKTITIDKAEEIENNFIYDIDNNTYNQVFFISKDRYTNTFTSTTIPRLIWDSSTIVNVVHGSSTTESLFKFENNETLCATLSSDNVVYKWLDSLKFFDTNFNINYYLLKVPTNVDKELSRDYLINTTSLYINRLLYHDTNTPTTYVETIQDTPELIRDSENYLVYNSALGNHLVTYINNKVFISLENKPYWFVQDYMKEYPEPVVKVIEYKDMLLVFTTQNLYAIYLYETTTSVQNGTDSEGNVQYVQQTVYSFATLPVLYNLMVDSKYKDAIQVYNQMVLFYSSDGQLFLIKPTAAIDSNTRFSIQYFNKSANDILLNYRDYIQERLQVYGFSDIIEEKDIKINVSATINYIKVFYSVPDLITYILVYDVLNNRYYTYDTIAFNNINSLQYIPTGEMYVTEHNDRLYFTVQHINTLEFDGNVDTMCYDNFTQYPIKSELDTGTINLNNHLKKRFKDLHVIYKNLNASGLEFALETYVDDVPIVTYIESTFEVQNIAGASNTLVVVDNNKVKQLIEPSQLFDSNALFNFTDYTSNKIITHRSNIISKGKTIRVRMRFNSKGRYKIQGFGLIYKEHTI